MCRAALESPRKSIIFEPYPSVVDPNDPKTLAFNPKVRTLTTENMTVCYINTQNSCQDDASVLYFWSVAQWLSDNKNRTIIRSFNLYKWFYTFVCCSLSHCIQWMFGSTDEHRRRIMRDCRKHWTASCPFGKWPRYEMGMRREGVRLDEYLISFILIYMFQISKNKTTDKQKESNKPRQYL